MNLRALLIQVLVILIASRAVGWCFRKIRQPQVVGEMTAGLILGPSVLGSVAPHAFATIFPPGTLGPLNALSQIGLVLFMFLIGLELDPALLRGRGRTALATSQAGIWLPFILGGAYAMYLYPRLSSPSVGLTGFALFMGAARSVTAFPVLARILGERKLIGTTLGAITIACAAITDVTAWCILAVVLFVVRFPDAVHPSALALFAAFLAGALFRKRSKRVHDTVRKVEGFTVAFLLPLFFAFTGLRTSIGLVSGVDAWLYCAGLIAIAVMGKFGGSAIAARLTGIPGREAVAIGILMNTRGLMELVILNIGLDIGVISPTVFSMMVLMALVTTFMTTPLLQAVYPIGKWYGTTGLGTEASPQHAST